jgi:hypothetical protein
VPASAANGCHGVRADAVLHAHPGCHEAETRRLHDVDDQRQGEQGGDAPVRGRQRRILERRDHVELRRARRVARRRRQQAVAGEADTHHDGSHAEQHAVIHGHAGEEVAAAAGHQEHRQVKHDTRGDEDAAKPEGEGIAPLFKKDCLHQQPPVSIVRGAPR